MAPYEAPYGRKCCTPLCWNEVGEKQLQNMELIEATIQKVKLTQGRLKMVQDRQKGYADNRMRELEFEVGDKVFLKVSSCKGVIRFMIGHNGHVATARALELGSTSNYLTSEQ